MALLGSNVAGEVGLRLLLSPFSSNIVVRTACCSVGIALPVYSTFRAIESRDENEQQKWLLYWAAYGSFSLVEVFTDKLISWFPFYYHLKFAFLVWLQLPTVDGAKQLYSNHLRPLLLRHQARIDRVVDFTCSEIIKLIVAHQAEIQCARMMIKKLLGSDDQAPRHPSTREEPQDNSRMGEERTLTWEAEPEHDELSLNMSVRARKMTGKHQPNEDAPFPYKQVPSDDYVWVLNDNGQHSMEEKDRTRRRASERKATCEDTEQLRQDRPEQCIHVSSQTLQAQPLSGTLPPVAWHKKCHSSSLASPG